MRNRNAWLLVALVLSAPTSAWAAKSCDYSDMKGEEINFRQSYPGGEQYGYQLWYSKPDNGTRHLAYEPYVGKKGKVQDGIIEGKYGISKYKQVVLENCETVYVNLVNNEMPNDVYKSLDVDIAKLLIGKTIWVDQTYSARPLELVTLDRGVSYPLSNIEPVTVTDLYMAGIGHSRGSAPFFLKVRKASGKEGYLPFNTLYFSPQDPIPADTPVRIAEAIKGQKITLGMTAKQVELSWGKPEDVNRSVGSWGVHEQWVYGRQYVYLENGKVSSFQD